MTASALAVVGLLFTPPPSASAVEPPPIEIGTPLVVGIAAVGHQLRVDHADRPIALPPGGSEDTDRSVRFAYQWLADGTPIADAVDEVLTVTSAMAGKRISYRLTAVAEGFATTVIPSLATPRVTVPVRATIRGTMWPGNTMSMSPGVWPSGTTLKYQWLMNAMPIAGAVGSSLAVPADGGGTTIAILVTASRPGYETLAVYSQRDPIGLAVFPLRVVSAVPAEVPPNQAPGMLDGEVHGVDATVEELAEARVRVYSLGTGLTAANPVLVAEVSTDSTGRFSVPNLTPGSYCTTVVSPDARFASVDNCKGDLTWSGVRIFAGAVSATSIGLWPAAALRGVVSATNGSKVVGGTVNVYRQYTLPSGALGLYRVASARTDGSGRYSISGLEGGFVHLQFSGPTPSSHPTVWWDPHPGMTSSLPTARSAGGVTLEDKTTATANITLPAYLPIGVPRIKGTLRVGGKLTAVHPKTSGATYAYQWYANGKPIKGAARQGLTLARGQAGKTITVKVVGKRKGYATTSRTSTATAKVLMTSPTRILGTPVVGHRLTAAHGVWTSGTRFAYQWYNNGKPIPGATKKTYVLKTSDRRDRISVKVTGKKTGYATVSRAGKTGRVRG